MEKYRVQTQETLEEISYKLFGNSTTMLDLIIINNRKLCKYDVLPIGVIVDIPAIETTKKIVKEVDLWD